MLPRFGWRVRRIVRISAILHQPQIELFRVSFSVSCLMVLGSDFLRGRVRLSSSRISLPISTIHNLLLSSSLRLNLSSLTYEIFHLRNLGKVPNESNGGVTFQIIQSYSFGPHFSTPRFVSDLIISTFLIMMKARSRSNLSRSLTRPCFSRPSEYWNQLVRGASDSPAS